MVVRLRAVWTDGDAAQARRLRRDRERRPRVDGGRARRARGLREVLRQSSRRVRPAGEDGLMVDVVGQRPRRRRRTARIELDLGAGLRRLDWLLLLAVGALVGYGLWAIAGITRFDVPGDPRHYRHPAGDRRGPRRRRVRRGHGRARRLSAAPLAGPLRRHDRADGLRLRRSPAIRGSKRWIDIGPFQFQPSEFGKMLFVLAIAGFLVEQVASHRRRSAPSSRRSVSARSRWRSSSCSPTSARRSSTPPPSLAVLFVAGVRWLHLALLGALAALLVVSASSGSCPPRASRCSSRTRRPA